MEWENNHQGLFIQLVNTIARVVIWALINFTIGIYLGWGLFSDSPRWQNYLYYLFFLATTVWLVMYLKKKWWK